LGQISKDFVCWERHVAPDDHQADSDQRLRIGVEN
jgi:hypothetical protein